MKHRLRPRAGLREPTDYQIRLAFIDREDEFVCGTCGHLLAVDGVLRPAAAEGDVPGTPGGIVRCTLCNSDLETDWATSGDRTGSEL